MKGIKFVARVPEGTTDREVSTLVEHALRGAGFEPVYSEVGNLETKAEA